jgi:hypothetical protein
MVRLWVDLDGVLVDLETGYREHTGLDGSKEVDAIDWSLVRDVPRFFARLPLMPGAMRLWAAVAHLEPAILSGVPGSMAARAARHKRAWVDRNLGPDVLAAFCPSRDKSLYCRPGDVLVDDWEKYRHLWERAGGAWVTHRDADGTVAALRSMGVL